MTQTDKRYKNGEWMKEKYIMEEWSTTDIAKFCGTSHKTIGYWLNKHGINARSSSASQLTSIKVTKRQRIAEAKPKLVFDDTKPSLRW